MGDAELMARIECAFDDVKDLVQAFEVRQVDGNKVQTLKDALEVLLEVGAPIYVRLNAGSEAG